ncbi:MAG: ABC transporter ATP-binding protein [Bradymonadia bacterium]
MLHIEHLTVRYGDRAAVDDLDLHVPEGSLFGLLGPNGAGKTTTLSSVVGLRRPDAGRITVAGIDVAADPQGARRVLGWVPQSLALYPELTVKQNLKAFGGLYDLRGATLQGRINEALELAQLVDRAGSKVGHLSGGMQRRLNLAVALLHKPKLLICDEPTTGVDPQSRNHLFETIKRLNATGMTVIYTTHYMEEVQALCDRVAIMDAGRIIVEDTLQALLGRPGDRWFDLDFEGPVTAAQVEQALRDAGLPISAIRPRPRTLETLFLEHTGHGLRDET